MANKTLAENLREVAATAEPHSARVEAAIKYVKETAYRAAVDGLYEANVSKIICILPRQLDRDSLVARLTAEGLLCRITQEHQWWISWEKEVSPKETANEIDFDNYEVGSGGSSSKGKIPE